MKQEALSYFTDTYLTVIGMGLFMFAFCVISYWVVRSSNREHLERMAHLPLENNGGDRS